MSHIKQSGPQVDKYHGNIEDLEKIDAKAIEPAVNGCDVVDVDEVGPMEQDSAMFKKNVEAALNSSWLTPFRPRFWCSIFLFACVYLTFEMLQIEDYREKPSSRLC